jgi:hypothetical protein
VRHFVLEGGTADPASTKAHEGLDVTRHETHKARRVLLVAEVVEEECRCANMVADG